MFGESIIGVHKLEVCSVCFKIQYYHDIASWSTASGICTRESATASSGSGTSGSETCVTAD